MPTTPATGDPTARRVDEQFLDLICNDQDLLAAEFDAIIAAEWPNAPANPAGHGPTGRHPTSPAARWLMTHIRGSISRGHGTPASADGPGNAHPRSETWTGDRQEGR
jgi:hypothetical protein